MTASHLQNQKSPAPVLDVAPVSDRANSTSALGDLLNNGSYRVKEERALIECRTVEPATTQDPSDNPYACVLSAPSTTATPLGKRLRNGKIARLPKLERDLVNKLLHNNVSYSQIVWALDERNITVTERNISNWRTRGGYKEWCAEQENQLRLAHLQDHLTDYLRKHDAQQLPEVGLQVAATQLTSLLMNPQTAAPLLANPDKYARIVDSLDKCSARLKELQNDRYENVRRASIRDTVPNIRSEEAREIEIVRKIASAEKLPESSRDEIIPNRNELPPREVMPYIPPGPTFAQLLGLQLNNASKAKQLTNSPSAGAQPTGPGNQTETHGNSR
jgi:hypothetical protein